jgi:uncharacterized protein YjiS (DUF1127 family)
MPLIHISPRAGKAEAYRQTIFDRFDRAMHQAGALRWADRARSTLAHRPARLFALIAAWVRRSEDRRELAGLDDRALRDIAVTRVEAMREIEKPFWRA